VTRPDTERTSSPPGASRREARSLAFVAVRRPPTFVHGSSASQSPSPSVSGHGSVVLVDVLLVVEEDVLEDDDELEVVDDDVDELDDELLLVEEEDVLEDDDELEVLDDDVDELDDELLLVDEEDVVEVVVSCVK